MRTLEKRFTRFFVLFIALGFLFSISSPTPVEAQGNSKIEIIQFDFVELKGRAGHQGLFPISGEPVKGSVQQVNITLMGSFQTATFHFTAEDGTTVLQDLNLESVSQVIPGAFSGLVQLPNQPFRIAASGLDLDGNSYFEVSATIFQARTVEINFDTSISRVDIGTTTLSGSITNHGPPENFNIEVQSTMNLVTRLEPGSLYLATGESGVFEADITVPEDMPEFTFLDVKVIATGASNVDATNSSKLEFHTEVLPHITVPADITAPATANKDLTPVNNDPPEGFPVGSHSVTWEVIDSAGNTDSADQSISITGLTLDITQAKVKVHPNRGKLKILGNLNLENTVDGINPSQEEVTLKIGDFVETLSIGSFKEKKKGNVFKYKNRKANGIKRMKINLKKNTFKATIKKINTSTFDPLQSKIITLIIGDDQGENSTIFLKQDEMDKDKDKDKDND